MSELPPKFTEDGKAISFAWEAELRGHDAFGYYDEDCPVCGEGWTVYCDTREQDGVEKALAEQGRFFGEVWVCEDCVKVYESVCEIASKNPS